MDPHRLSFTRLRATVSKFRAFRARVGKPFELIESCRERLRADPDCTGRVGVIGFCMGGGTARYRAENWVNPLSLRFTQVAPYVKRQQGGLTQVSDSTQLVMSFRKKYQKANQTATMAYPIDHNAPVIISEKSTLGARASRQAYA
jgi:Dienelactone hydrolase family